MALRVYRKGEPVALADLLPLLGHLGLRALDEHPYRFVVDGTECFLYDIGVRVPLGVQIGDLRPEIRAALEGLLAGTIEPDGFNRLILLAGLTASQANILRCYAKYAHQTDFTFSQGYVEDSLARLPQLARLVVDLFEARSTPKRTTCRTAPCWSPPPSRPVHAALDEVPSLDDDRMDAPSWPWSRRRCARARTRAARRWRSSSIRGVVPELPDPRPAHEIFGVHRTRRRRPFGGGDRRGSLPLE